MSRRNIPELLQVRAEDHDLPWLTESLQWAVELEFATIPVYLSGMWSIKQQNGDVYNLIHSVVLEEMLHMGWACNMLTAIDVIDVKPQINAPSYPGPLPGGVQPGFEVYLGGLSKTTVAMYMQIELPEHPVAEAESFPTIGAFYDAISAAFTALFPPNHQFSTTNQIGDFSIGQETLTVLNSLEDVQNAIATIKEQGEGTSTSPDAPQFGGELAHYYRFGEILNEKTLIEVDGQWQYAGDAVPFPDCYPVAKVPVGGYPGVDAVQTFDNDYGTLIGQLQNAWSLPGTNPNGGSNGLNNALGTMFSLTQDAQAVVTQPLPGGSGNYGPDFRPPAAGSARPAVT
jgi:Ferritin-like